MTTETEPQLLCYHCGTPCDDSIQADEKSFCCNGCKTVFEIITANNLSTYYSLNERPGIRATEKKFGYLDNPEIAEDLLTFSNNNTSKVILKLPDIHCSSCIWLLENLARLLPGVLRCQVNFTNKEAAILYQSEILKLSELAGFLSSIGYTPDISVAQSKNEVRQTKKRRISQKIAVAGFCFGNSMLLSLPEYLDSTFLLNEDFRWVFGLLNIVLALPVVLFSGSGYFTAAYKGLKKRFISMDLPIALGIATLFIRSLFEIITQSGSGYMDSLTGLVFFLMIGQWYQGKTYHAFSFDRDFKSFFPIAVSRILADKTIISVPIKKIRIGDLIQIHNDEVIPMDGVIEKGVGEIDYSFVTGEADINLKVQGETVYAGGRQKGQSVKIRVSNTVEAGYLTSLWNQGSGKGNKANLEIAANAMGRYFTIAIISIAVLSGTIWFFLDPTRIWMIVSSILIVACPCALALATPFAFGQAMRVLGNSNLYLRNASVVEQLAKSRQLVFDKTGTLTTEKSGRTAFHGDLTPAEKSWVVSLTRQSLHPVSQSIAAHLAKFDSVPVSGFKEHRGKGIEAEVSGHIVKMGSNEFINSQNHQSGTYVMIDGINKGFFDVNTNYREGIFQLLEVLQGKFRLHLLSGDRERDRSSLTKYFEKVLFRQLPDDKLQYIREVQKESPTVMIGDGLNDAGALRQAHTGIAVVDDLHRFSPASDAILKGSELPILDRFIELCRSSMKIVYAAFAMSLMYNVIGLSFAISGNLTPVFSAILMPISSVSVVAFVTISIQYIGKKLMPPTDKNQ